MQAVLTEIKDDVSDTKLLDHLLLEATGSDRQPIEKGEILVSHGADLNRLPSLGGCTVFHVAANRGLPVLIQLALKRGMKYDLVDEDGNTPIHYAAECGTGGAECIQLLVDSGGDVNARNKFGRTPIFSAVASENLAAVVELIKCGSRLPSLSIARKCGPRQVGILADIQIVESAYNPLQTALKIGGFFKKCAKVNIGYNDQYNQWAAAMETVATEMLDCNQSDGISELLSYPIIYCAVENRQKQVRVDLSVCLSVCLCVCVSVCQSVNFFKVFKHYIVLIAFPSPVYCTRGSPESPVKNLEWAKAISWF